MTCTRRGELSTVHSRWVQNGLTSRRNRPLESSAVGRKPNSDEGSKYSDELSAEKVNESWETKAGSFKGVEEITEW